MPLGRRLTCALAVGVMMIAVLAARVTLANGLPVRFVRHPTWVLVPHHDTPVGVTHETLTFDFREASPNGRVWLPLVSAAYELHNPSSDSQQLDVAFLYVDVTGQGNPPIPVREGEPGLEIVWQREPLPVRVSDPPTAAVADLRSAELHWLDPVTGERYAVHAVEDSQLKAAVASFLMQPGSKGLLEVRYRQHSSGCDECRRRIGEPIWHYTYLLRPARHWAFFGSLTIRVHAPPGMMLAAEPALDRTGDGVWEGTFPSLPAGDLHLSVRPPGHAVEIVTAWTVLTLTLGLGAWIVWRRVKAMSVPR